MTDATMDAITDAVTLGRAGDPDRARRALLELWGTLGPDGDPFHRCTLAHYLADLYPHEPARALVWNVRALDAADACTPDRVRAHHAAMDLAGFYPSLHANLADDHRRLDSFDAAREHLDAARAGLARLSEDEYGALIRALVDRISRAVADGDTAPLEP